jgi:hypothetical protein
MQRSVPSPPLANEFEARAEWEYGEAIRNGGGVVGETDAARGQDKKLKKEYKAPTVTVLGSLHQLTLDMKVGHVCDLTCYHHGSA